MTSPNGLNRGNAIMALILKYSWNPSFSLNTNNNNAGILSRGCRHMIDFD